MELMNDIENFDEIYDKISDSDCVENENLITSTKVSKKSYLPHATSCLTFRR